MAKSGITFKVENTGTSAWKKVLDKKNNWVANLDEMYNEDWVLVKLKSRERLSENYFSSPSKAINWLNKNPEVLNEISPIEK